MHPASIVSPFRAQESSTDWVCWQKDQPINMLQDDLHTERRYFQNDERISDQTSPVLPSIYQATIDRPRYKAVIEKFSQANKKTGEFLSWT